MVRLLILFFVGKEEEEVGLVRVCVCVCLYVLGVETMGMELEKISLDRSLLLVGSSLTLVSLSFVGILALKLLEPSSPAAANTLFKLDLFWKYAVYFFLSRDKSYRAEPPTGVATEVKRKKVIFVRHGESEWNMVFNKGFGPMFIVRLLGAVVREILLIPTRDSVFIDSSLSKEGLGQVQELKDFVDSSAAPTILKAGSVRPQEKTADRHMEIWVFDYDIEVDMLFLVWFLIFLSPLLWKSHP